MGAGCNQDKLLFEKLFDKALHFFRAYRIPFFSAIVFGFLAHGFVFTNKCSQKTLLTYAVNGIRI